MTNLTPTRSKFTWSQSEAIHVCRQVEPIAAAHGCHVALTGGCLYLNGERKDVDLIFYRSADEEEIPIPKLLAALESDLGIHLVTDHGYVKKAVMHLREWPLLEWDVDLLFPNEPGKYPKASPLSFEQRDAITALWNEGGAVFASVQLESDAVAKLLLAIQLLEDELNCYPRSTPKACDGAAAGPDTLDPDCPDSYAMPRPAPQE